MAITKTNFYAQSLNQFGPHRLRGEYLDWGLNAMVMEVQIDASEAGTLYAGDPVEIASTSTGKLKVVACDQAHAPFGFIIFNPKKESYKAGDIVSVLCKDGVMECVTEDAINAGVSVYYKVSDGSVTTTQPTNAVLIGKTMAKVSATSGGTLVPVLIG